jgi:membrane associated rhomboid family serine protease
MNSASVGFHCPECTKTGSQRVYRPGDLVSKPTLVYGVIGLCVAAFVAQLVTGEGDWARGEVTNEGLLFGPFVQDGEYWRMITSGFLHAGIIHLAFNMYALYIFGPAVQRAVGLAKTILIYVGGLFGGSAGVLLFNWDQGTLGASGAVLGLAGGLAGILWARGINITQTSLGGIFLLNLALPLFTNISFWGHFGGIVGGFVVAMAMAKADSSMRPTHAMQDSNGPSPALVVGGAVVVALAVLGVVGANLGLDSVL